MEKHLSSSSVLKSSCFRDRWLTLTGENQSIREPKLAEEQKKHPPHPEADHKPVFFRPARVQPDHTTQTQRAIPGDLRP